MVELTHQEQRAFEYLQNAFPVTVSRFDEDWEPIGPQLRHQLMTKGAAWVDEPYIYQISRIWPEWPRPLLNERAERARALKRTVYFTQGRYTLSAIVSLLRITPEMVRDVRAAATAFHASSEPNLFNNLRAVADILQDLLDAGGDDE